MLRQQPVELARGSVHVAVMNAPEGIAQLPRQADEAWDVSRLQLRSRRRVDFQHAPDGGKGLVGRDGPAVLVLERQRVHQADGNDRTRILVTVEQHLAVNQATSNASNGNGSRHR